MRRYLDNVVKFICIILMSALVIVTFLQVVNRFVFKYPLGWTEEIARFLSVWMCLMGAAYCVRENSHIEIDIVFQKFGQKMKRILSTSISIVFLTFCLIVFWEGVSILNVIKIQKAAASQINLVFVYIAGPISVAIMSVYLIGQVYDSYKKQ